MSQSYLHLRNIVCLLLTIFLVNCGAVFGQKKKEPIKISGFFDLNGYQDTREFSVITYNILVNLPKRFQYFSLSNHQTSKGSFEFDSYYAEHNLRWGIGKVIPLDLTLQYVSRNGADNDDLRLGFRWKVNQTKGLKKLFSKLNMSYTMNPMLVQFNKRNTIEYATQIEHVYSILIAPKLFDSRLYLNGFVDQNLGYNDNGGISIDYVSEHQLGFRVVDQLFAVIEYRINDYFLTDNYGLGYGLEYKILF